MYRTLLFNLARIFYELLSRDHAIGNPLVADTTYDAALSGLQAIKQVIFVPEKKGEKLVPPSAANDWLLL